jgi:hypothetical protein
MFCMKNLLHIGCGPNRNATLAGGRAPFFDLWALASKSLRPDGTMRELATQHFPA